MTQARMLVFSLMFYIRETKTIADYTIQKKKTESCFSITIILIKLPQLNLEYKKNDLMNMKSDKKKKQRIHRDRHNLIDFQH